jgi:hypothetical protein
LRCQLPENLGYHKVSISCDGSGWSNPTHSLCVCVFLGCGRAKTRPASGWSCATTSCTSSKRLSVCKVGFHWSTKGSTFCCIRPKWVCCRLFLGFSHWEEQLFTFPGNSHSWIRERRIHYLDIYLRAILQWKKKASEVVFMSNKWYFSTLVFQFVENPVVLTKCGFANYWKWCIFKEWSFHKTGAGSNRILADKCLPITSGLKKVSLLMTNVQTT